MASGLPVACSNRGPMPEVLGSAGLYFDPEDPQDIASAVQALMQSPDLRRTLAAQSFARAQSYSWKRCALETLEFLARVAHRSAPQRHHVQR
jgi:glycosyltransferase involved in cell wall biosynthesis